MDVVIDPTGWTLSYVGGPDQGWCMASKRGVIDLPTQAAYRPDWVIINVGEDMSWRETGAELNEVERIEVLGAAVILFSRQQIAAVIHRR